MPTSEQETAALQAVYAEYVTADFNHAKGKHAPVINQLSRNAQGDWTAINPTDNSLLVLGNNFNRALPMLKHLYTTIVPHYHGRLLDALRDWDYGTFHLKDNVIIVDWSYPTDRENNRRVDTTAFLILIATDYLEVDNDGDLFLTPRGYTIVLRYRPYSWRQMPCYPNYLNWLQNAKRFQYYLQLYPDNP